MSCLSLNVFEKANILIIKTNNMAHVTLFQFLVLIGHAPGFQGGYRSFLQSFLHFSMCFAVFNENDDFVERKRENRFFLLSSRPTFKRN